MEFLDKNMTLEPPKDFTIQDVTADGAYLKVLYTQSFWENPLQRGEHRVTVYLNDMRREVARSTSTIFAMPIVEDAPAPVGRWFRFKNGFFIALQGVQEMLQCLKR